TSKSASASSISSAPAFRTNASASAGLANRLSRKRRRASLACIAVRSSSGTRHPIELPSPRHEPPYSVVASPDSSFPFAEEPPEPRREAVDQGVHDGHDEERQERGADQAADHDHSERATHLAAVAVS